MENTIILTEEKIKIVKKEKIGNINLYDSWKQKTDELTQENKIFLDKINLLEKETSALNEHIADQNNETQYIADNFNELVNILETLNDRNLQV